MTIMPLRAGQRPLSETLRPHATVQESHRAWAPNRELKIRTSVLSRTLAPRLHSRSHMLLETMPDGDQCRDDKLGRPDYNAKLPHCPDAIPQRRRGLCPIRRSIFLAPYSMAFIAPIQTITTPSRNEAGQSRYPVVRHSLLFDNTVGSRKHFNEWYPFQQMCLLICNLGFLP